VQIFEKSVILLICTKMLYSSNACGVTPLDSRRNHVGMTWEESFCMLSVMVPVMFHVMVFVMHFLSPFNKPKPLFDKIGNPVRYSSLFVGRLSFFAQRRLQDTTIQHLTFKFQHCFSSLPPIYIVRSPPQKLRDFEIFLEFFIPIRHT